MTYCRLALIGALVVAAPISMVAAQSVSEVKTPPKPLVLEAEGSFFVGGEPQMISDNGWDALNRPGFNFGPGTVMRDQMYVQFQRPVSRTAHVPVVFVHGCCLTAKTWETTPDGRMGWYEYFTRSGHATYLADQVGRGRSALEASRVNAAREGKLGTKLPPVFIATREMMWRVFRLGPEVGKFWPGQKFPTDHVDELEKQIVPDFSSYYDRDWFSHFEDANFADPTARDLAQLATSLNGAVLIGHSASSGFPTQAALIAKHGVRGIVAIETGCFPHLTPAQVTTLSKVPILILIGDFQRTPGIPASCEAERKAVTSAGGDFTFLALPNIGIHGNSHMMMQDTNNLEVADVILKWIRDHVEKRPTK